jgi:hypothetical protein
MMRPFFPITRPSAEINATIAKPVGSADVVAKVKPAVIAVRVRLESDAQMDADEPDRPSQSRPFSEHAPLHRGRNQQRQASPLGRSDWTSFPSLTVRSALATPFARAAKHREPSIAIATGSPRPATRRAQNSAPAARQVLHGSHPLPLCHRQARGCGPPCGRSKNGAR